MDNIIHKKFKAENGNIISIVYDNNAENPFTEWDSENSIQFFFLHKNYTLSKEGYNFSDYSDMIRRMAKQLLPTSVLNWKWIEEGLYYGFNDEENEKLLNLMDRYAYVLPVYMYDHSGITIRTTPFSCGWDSGKVGYVAMTKREAKANKFKKQQSYDYLIETIKSIDNYITGEVFGFYVEDSEEVIDSCFGFYGDNFEENGLFDYLEYKKEELTEI